MNTSSGHPITEVTEEDIARLTPETLVDVTRRLLFCEARRLGIERPKIYWTMRLTVPDGGRDLGWENPLPEPVVYIPRDKTFYQSKATGLTEGSIKDEMVSSADSDLKPRVREVLEEGGAYVFVTTDSWIKREPQLDIDAIAVAACESVGFSPHPDACVAVLGREKLVEWVNCYLSMISYVLRVTRGFPVLHLFDVQAWGETPELEGAYISTEGLVELRDQLRAKLLANPGSVIRLTGLSGLGKTRLAYQAVSPADQGDLVGELLQSCTVYFNYGDHGQPALNALLNLAGAEYEGIVIVDDCPPDVHRRIQQRVGGRRLTVLTLYHETEGKGDDRVVFLPDDNVDVVPEILKADPRSENFTAQQLTRIAQVGEGFPEFAIMMLDLGLMPTDRLLHEVDIASRLLGDGVHRDQVAEAVFAAHSLFRRVGGHQRLLRDQTRFVEDAFVTGINSCELEACRGRLERRGLLKLMGDIRLPAPRPLAVAFAVRAIQSVNPTEWPDRLAAIEQAGLLDSFCDRLSEIEYSEHRDEIGTLLCEALPFHEHCFLGSAVGGQLFRSVALLSPGGALQAVRVALQDDAVIGQLEGSACRNIVGGLEYVAWRAKFFSPAAGLMLRLAAHGPETEREEVAGSLANFFLLSLSGTRKPARERLGIIREALVEGDTPIKLVAIRALGSGFQSRHFSRMDDSSLAGVRDPEKDWRPETRAEMADYQREVFQILAPLALGEGEEAAAACQTIENGLVGIFYLPLLDDLDAEFKAIADSKDNLWPPVKSMIKSKLEFRGDKMAPACRAALERWLGYVTPDAASFENRYEDLVANPGYHHRERPDGSYIDLSSDEAKALADEIVGQRLDLTEHLDTLLVGPQQEGFSFGERLAAISSQLDELIDAILRRWPELDEKERNSSVLRGIAHGLGAAPARRRAFLERIDRDPELSDLLIAVTSCGPLEDADIAMIRCAIVEDRADPRDFPALGCGGVTKPLEVTAFTRELALILDAKPEMAGDILRVLSMYCHRRQDRFEATAELFKRLVIHPQLEKLDGMLGHDWKTAVLRLIRLAVDDEWYRTLTRGIIRRVQDAELHIRTGELAEVAGLLFARAPEIVAPLYSEALEDEDDIKVHRVGYFLSRADGWRDDAGSPLWEMELDRFRAWLRDNPKLIGFLLREMPLCLKLPAEDPGDTTNGAEGDEPRPRYGWHRHALILLEEGVSEKNMAIAVHSNLTAFECSGSMVPHLKEKKRLVETLRDNESENSSLRNVAETVIACIDEEIEQEKLWDLNHRARFM